MPTVATVEGVKIQVYANEHPPPHVHLRIAEHQAVMDIETLKVTEGSIPLAKKRKVVKWAKSRQTELRRAFEQAISLEPVEPIK